MSGSAIEVIDARPNMIREAFPNLKDMDPGLDIGFVPALGFLAIKPGDKKDEGLQLIGVYTPSEPRPDVPRDLVVPHDVEDVKPRYLSSDRVGKGVLGRFWNNEYASRGWIDDPAYRGVYSFVLNPDRLHYVTQPFSGGFIQAAGRIKAHHDLSERHPEAIKRAYRKQRVTYGDSQAIFMTEPPRPKLRRISRNAWPVPKDMDASFIAPIVEGAAARRIGIIQHE